MPCNAGYIEASWEGKTARLYYASAERPVGAGQKLAAGPSNGPCLVLSGGARGVRINGVEFTANRTLAQVRSALPGVTTRGQITQFEVY